VQDEDLGPDGQVEGGATPQAGGPGEVEAEAIGHEDLVEAIVLGSVAVRPATSQLDSSTTAALMGTATSAKVGWPSASSTTTPLSTQAAWSMPLAKDHRPDTTRPPSTRRPRPTGATWPATRGSWPPPNTRSAAAAEA
jgi:hypothetical protein